MPFVQSLFETSVNVAGSSLVLSGSKVVTAGNTIFLAAGIGSATASGYSATDNLGNTYALVKSTINANGFGAHLWRADVTKPGTLTTITITHPVCTRRNAIALEFSGVSTLRGTNAGSLTGTSNQPSAYPGSSIGSTTTYVATDLWLGAFAFNGTITGFDPGGAGDSVTGVEPTPEQQVPGNVGVAFFYYLSDTGATFKRLIGTFAGAVSRDYAAVGAAYQMVATGPKYNDAPSGQLTLGGSVVESYSKHVVYTDAAAGAFALAGSCVDNWSTGTRYTDATAGTLALGGASAESAKRSDSASGSIALSGSATDSYTVGVTHYNDLPVGTLKLSGALLPSVAFIKSLFAGSIKNAGTSLIMSGSTPVKVGQTILVSAGTVDVGSPMTVTDNLGNVYTLLKGGWSASVRANLFRADVTKSGVLTTITVDQPNAPATNPFGAIAVLFAQVGAVRRLGNPDTGDDIRFGAYPGVDLDRTEAYVPGDLWIGAFVQRSVNTFGPAGLGVYAPLPNMKEPTVEQVTAGGDPNVSVGLLYYISERPITGTLMGLYGLHAQGASIGASLLARPVGPFVSDVVSGDLTLTGSCVESWQPAIPIFDDAPAGSLTLVGSRTENRVASDAQTGLLKLAGTASSRHILKETPGGSVALSGTAVESWYIRTVYSDRPTGAINISGSSSETRRGNDKPSGRVTIIGTSADRIIRTRAVSGSLALAGARLEKLRFGDRVSAILVITGSAQEKKGLYDARTGTIKLSGVASQHLTHSGSVSDIYKLAGSCSEFIDAEGRRRYDDFPTGLLRIVGRTVLFDDSVTPGRGGRVVYGFSGRVVKNLGAGRTVRNLTGQVTT